MSDTKEKLKSAADSVADSTTEALDKTYNKGLNKITQGHKPDTAKSRLFVAGLILGFLLGAALLFIF